MIVKQSVFKHQTRWINGRHVFDVSQFSEVISNFPPHPKMQIIVCTNYARNFMLSSESAKSLHYYCALCSTMGNRLQACKIFDI